MLKKMISMSRSVALLLAMYMLLSPAASAAVELATIANSECGPTQAFKAAGMSKNMLPHLRHHDGSEIDPKEYRSLSGDKLYYVADAKPDAKKTAELIAAEIKHFGVVKVPAECAKGNCAEVDQLKKQVDEAAAAINQLREQAVRDKQTIDSLKAEMSSLETQNRIMWVMLALAFLIGCGLGYMLGRILSAKAVEKAVSEKDAAEVSRDSAQQELKNLSDKWNNIEQVQLRLQQLRTAQS